MLFNDTSDDMNIITVYMDEYQTIDDHKEFPNDATGMPLRYKILIEDMAVHAVLYNDGQSID